MLFAPTSRPRGPDDLEMHPPDPPPPSRRNATSSLQNMVGFTLLSFNSAMAISRSLGDAWAITFILGSYVTLLLLFYVLRVVEGEAAWSPYRSRRLRTVHCCTWLLTSMLAALFSYKVATILPLPIAVVVWVMAATSAVGGFYAFFLPNREEGSHL